MKNNWLLIIICTIPVLASSTNCKIYIISSERGIEVRIDSWHYLNSNFVSKDSKEKIVIVAQYCFSLRGICHSTTMSPMNKAEDEGQLVD